MCILIVVNDFIMICNSSLQRIPFLTSCCANSLVFYHFTFRVEKYCCFFHKMTVYVVVNFLSQVIFIFLLFLGMSMYANGVSTKEKEKLPEIKN